MTLVHKKPTLTIRHKVSKKSLKSATKKKIIITFSALLSVGQNWKVKEFWEGKS